LDREGITTPGAIATSFLIAVIPTGGQFYQDYNTRTKTSTWPPTVGAKAVQASTDSGGTYTKVTDGEYIYTFGKKLPADYAKNATHSVGMYGSRNLTEFDLGTNYATDVYTFVPDGTAVTTVHDVINTKSCNKCHSNLSFHGGSRIGMPLCVMCHTPAYGNVQNTNPETGNSIDLEILAHKIHMGANLPSVKAGQPYIFVGFGNSVSDWSNVEMPSQPENCQWCHVEGNEAAVQKDLWLTAPTMAACGACHDNVDFATGKNHVGLPQFNNNQCANCHIPQGEIDFDASIKGAHVVPQYSNLVRGLVMKIEKIENFGAGQKPTITVSIKDRKGNPWNISDLIPGSGRGRLALTIAGPTPDYTGFGPTGYVQQSLTPQNVTGTAGLYTYSFTTAIPASATGTWAVGSEGRSDETVLAGTLKQQAIEVGAVNDVVYFSPDNSTVTPPAAVAKNDLCNQCHFQLSVHGENRNRVDYCLFCHNAIMTDVARRPAAQGPPESIDMILMIHRIHTGASQIRDYTIYGFGNTPINFNDVQFPPPNTPANCTACHLSGTQNVPANPNVQPIVDPRGWITPVSPTSGACLACHVTKDAASHVLANTSSLGDSCAVCHGPGADFAVTKVHAQ